MPAPGRRTGSSRPASAGMSLLCSELETDLGDVVRLFQKPRNNNNKKTEEGEVTSKIAQPAKALRSSLLP